MDDEDLILLSGAAVAGFFILKGAFKLPDVLQKLADVAWVDTYNAAAGATNSLGLTNTQANTNAWGQGVAVMTTTQNLTQTQQQVVNDNWLYGITNTLGLTNSQAGVNAWGEGTSLSYSNSGDWISGVHLW